MTMLLDLSRLRGGTERVERRFEPDAFSVTSWLTSGLAGVAVNVAVGSARTFTHTLAASLVVPFWSMARYT